jgi:polyisoprenoid-binding protein YceI
MRKFSLLTVLVLLIITACSNPAANKPKAAVSNAQPESSPASAGPTEALQILPDNSKVDFVASKVTRSHNGSFKQFSGRIDLAVNNIPDSRVTIDIDTASVEVDDPQLTAHLKTPDFFDVAKFPKATFASTKIEKNGNGDAPYTVTGNFDLHGVKRSISFPANIEVNPDAVSVNAEFAINRKDFGIVYPGKPDDLIRDDVLLKLNLRVPRKK